jgi:hypothetical protein
MSTNDRPTDTALSDAERKDLWVEHARCVALADAAKAVRRMAQWHYYSDAAAKVLEELA